MKRLLFLAPVVAFLALMGVFFAGLHRDPTILPSMMIGKPAPSFALAPVRPGDVGLTTADLKGGPVLLNYYASWCVACRVEHPMLLRLHENGVVIHGIDWKDEAAKGNEWLVQRGDPYVKVGNDESGRTGIDMGVSGVPETFVIDKTGRVRYRQVGPITEEVWTGTLQPLLAKLQAES
jgi:cytochrome c biogenesis protein CcmG/thiol:disulfide interchange protein DsbE